MSEKKKIDRLFQERFKDFESAPPSGAWQNIEAELRKKKKRRVVPLWLSLSGVAAGLILGILLFNFLSGKPDRETPNEVVVTTPPDSFENNNGDAENVASEDNGSSIAPVSSPKQKEITPSAPKTLSSGMQQSVAESAPNQKTTGSSNKNLQLRKGVSNRGGAIASGEQDRPSSISANRKHKLNHQKELTEISSEHRAIVENNLAQHPQSDKASQQTDRDFISADKNKSVATADQKNAKTDRQNITEKLQNSDNQTEPVVAENITIKDSLSGSPTANPLEQLLVDKEKKEVTTSESKLNRWQVNPNIAPIYFSSVSDGSPLDSRFSGTNKTYKPSVSYGIGIQYAMNEKLALRTGIHNVSLEYDMNDIVFFQTPNARQLENVTPSLQGSLVEIDAPRTQVSAAFGRSDNKFQGTLTQKTGYIEVPVELSYNLIDRRFGVRLIGGFSTMFLNQNEVSLISNGVTMNIGEANNLNRMHFSTNLGFGVEYDIWKSLQFNLDPMFKYQLNTFSNDAGDFKPYYFGLYTGLSYRF